MLETPSKKGVAQCEVPATPATKLMLYAMRRFDTMKSSVDNFS